MVEFRTSTFTENLTGFTTFGVGMGISTAKGNGILLLLRGPGPARPGPSWLDVRVIH